MHQFGAINFLTETKKPSVGWAFAQNSNLILSSTDRIRVGE